MSARRVAGPRPARHPVFVTIVLASSTLAYAVSQTMVIPALPQISSDFGVDESQTAWVMTAFFISSAVCSGIVGRLGDMFGKRRMLLIAITCYGTGALASAAAPALPVLVVGRIVMGSGAGMVPLAYAIARDELDGSRVARAMGTIAMMIGLGAGIGMVLGGVLVDVASWHTSFLVAAGLSAVVFVLTLIVIPPSSLRSPARLDVVGALLLASGLGSVLFAISRGPAWGWSSPGVLLLAAAGLVALALLFRVESHRDAPLLHVPTLRLRPVLFTNLASLAMGSGQVAVSILVVQLAQLPADSGGLGVDASTAGLLIIPYSIAMVVGSNLAGMFAGRLGGRRILMIGASLATLGLIALAVAPVTSTTLCVLAGVSGLGISMTLVAAPFLLVQAVPQSRTGEANGANTIARAVGQSLGSQVTATVIAAHIVVGSEFPPASAYSVAFWLSAAGCASAILSGASIPRRLHSVQVSTSVDTHRLSGGAVAAHEGDDLIGDIFT